METARRNGLVSYVPNSGMEFDLGKTVLVFAAIVAVGTAALVAAPMMTPTTVVMMVTPSMIVFGAICLALGVKHGEYRSRGAR